MKLLLINSNRFHQPWPVMPFGLCRVASAAEAAGHEVRMLDLCFSKKPAREIAAAVAEFQPAVVGVSIRNIDNSVGRDTQFLLDEVRKGVVRPLKQAFTGPVVVGGPAVGINGAEILEFLDLEYALRGDGETALVEFLRRLEQGEALQGTPGLVMRKNGRLLAVEPPAQAKNLDALPQTRAHRWVDLPAYRRFNSPLQIQTKRGCALRCSYCTYNCIEGRRFRLREPQKIADEIESMVEETGVTEIEFTDSVFNVPLSHAKAVLRAVAAKNLSLNLRTMGLNPGSVDAELVELMKKTGFREVDLGVESGSDLVLERLGKSFRKRHVLSAAKVLHTHGIPVTWYLMAGAPGETRETLRETFELVNAAASKWDFVNVGVGIRLYKGAPLAEEAVREGACGGADGLLFPVAYRPRGLNLEEVRALVRREAWRHNNWYLYGEDETTPPAVLKLGAWLIRRFAPRQPMWRLIIIIRLLQRTFGIAAVQRMWSARGPAVTQVPQSGKPKTAVAVGADRLSFPHDRRLRKVPPLRPVEAREAAGRSPRSNTTPASSTVATHAAPPPR